MEIPEKLRKFKYHILVGSTSILLLLLLLLVCYIAPNLVGILKYFWPLFLSTALFLVAVAVFGRIPPETEEKAGEGLLDFVAGQQPETEQVHPILEEEEEETRVEHERDDVRGEE